MINFTTTGQAAKINGCKILVYGPAGVGKTMLCATAPVPFLISAESGELSLKRFDIPMAKIATVDDLTEIYNWFAQNGDNGHFRTICIDSLSEIAEVVLNNAKRQVKDPRQAYGELLEKMETVIRFFRDLPGRNVYMSAKMEPMKDEMTGIVRYGPSMPGSKLGHKLPYFFDFVLRMGINKTPEGELYRFLQTQPDLQYEAKDRSGMLNALESPDLSLVFSKIMEN